MVNTTLLFLLLIPIILSVISYPILLKRMDKGDAALFSFGGIIVSAAILTAAVVLGKGYQMADTEIWNGEIVRKERIHDTYEQSYQCMCTSDSNGNQTCQTCYETHYTVEWKAFSTIEDFRISKLDRTSKRVYDEPDPPFYVTIQKGDPVAVAKRYKNYIKAVPESILRPTPSELKAKYAAHIPPYPLGIYDFYNLDRVVPVGVSVPNLREWNRALAKKLKTLGPNQQANVVVVLAKFDDPNYFYALQDAWLNGKKNDIVVVIGAPDFPAKPAWVNIMALTKTDMFQVQLRDALMDLETLDATSVMDIIESNTIRYFKRRSMKEFEYLEAEIDPPLWVVASTVVAIILAYIGFWLYTLHAKNNVFLRMTGRQRRYAFNYQRKW